MADALLQLINAMYDPDLTVTHASQVSGPGREPSLRYVEAPKDDELGPGAIEVEVVRIAVHRRQLRSRRTGGNFRDSDRSIRSAEPLHVRQRVAQAEHL